MLVSEIRGFGTDVGQLGSRYGVDLLRGWGEQLCRRSDHFDVDGIMVVLGGFEAIVSQCERLEGVV